MRKIIERKSLRNVSTIIRAPYNPLWPLIIPEVDMAYFSRHPEGYKQLLTWQNSVAIRDVVEELVKKFPQYKYRRLIDHLVDSGRSHQRNIEEGYKRETTKEYIKFLGFSRASLEEVKGDTDDCYHRYSLINEQEWDMLKTMVCQNDCLMGRQIASLEKKMDKEGTRSPQEKYRNWKRQYLQKEEKYRKWIEEIRRKG